MSFKDTLIRNLSNTDSTIGILGLGYVGLPLMLSYIEAGFKVVGIDVDQTKVDALSGGSSYIEHISADKIKSSLDKGFEPTTVHAKPYFLL